MNTVACAMSPCTRRTQRPSFRSIAGKRITAATSGNWRSAQGRASGSSRDGTACRRRCRGRRWRYGAAIVGRARRRRRDPRDAGDRSARNRRAAHPARSGCRREADARLATSSVFQPMCGIFSAGSAGSIGARRRAIQPRPWRRRRIRGRASPSAACRRRCRGTAARCRAPPPPAPRPCRARASRPRAAIGEGADAGQDDALGRDAPRSGSEVTTMGASSAGLARGALEGLVGRVQVARAVIDDRDGHRAPRSASGNRPIDGLHG